MTFLYNNINETDKNKKQTLKMILMDIVQTEGQYKRHQFVSKRMIALYL